MKPGSYVTLRNAKVDMFRGSMRLAVNQVGAGGVTCIACTCFVAAWLRARWVGRSLSDNVKVLQLCISAMGAAAGSARLPPPLPTDSHRLAAPPLSRSGARWSRLLATALSPSWTTT